MADDSGQYPDPPWKQAAVGRRARHSETELAKTDKGRRQPASGAFSGRKGDVRTVNFLIEDKFTDAESYTLTANTILKIMSEALRTPPGMRPQMRITMKGAPKLRLVLEDDYLWLAAKAGIDGTSG